MTDRFSGTATGLDAPATHGFAITPHDTNDLSEITRGLYVGGTGTLVAELASGAQITFAGVVGGTLLPVRVRKVLATGSTATQIMGLV